MIIGSDIQGEHRQRNPGRTPATVTSRANAGSDDVQGGFCKIESLGEKMTCRIWHNWKKWKPIRDKILERDNYTCQYSGCRKTLKQLQVKYRRKTRLLIVHHIKPEHLGGINEPENLATLCYTCHYRAAVIGSPVHKELNSPAAVTSRANASSGIQGEHR